MKRLSILFILLLCGFAQAAEPIQLARMNPYVAGSVAAACSNVPATDYVGLAADGGTADFTPSQNYIYCAPYTPTMTCTTGELDTFYIDKRYNGTFNVKGCLYHRTGNGSTAPESGDTKVYCTAEIANSETAGIKSVAVSGSVSISSTESYWICVVSDASRWEMSRTSDTTNGFYCNATSGGNYTTLPDDLYSCTTWSAEGQWQAEARFSIK